MGNINDYFSTGFIDSANPEEARKQLLDDAYKRISKNREDIRTREKIIQKYEQEIKIQREEAKKLKKDKNIDGLKLVLGRKIRAEKSLAETYTSIEAIENCNSSLKKAIENEDFVKGMDEMNRILKEIDVGNQVDKIAEITDNMHEVNNRLREASDLKKEFSSIGIDNEELERQLEELSDEALEEKIDGIKVGGDDLTSANIEPDINNVVVNEESNNEMSLTMLEQELM